MSRLHALFLQWSTQVRVGIIVFMCFVLAAGVCVAVLPGWARWILLTVLVLLAFLISGYVLWERHRLRKEAQAAKQGVEKELEKVPKEITSSEGRKRVEDVLTKFNEGFKKYQAVYGRDPYLTPWYLVVGEKRAGKTMVMQHCGLPRDDAFSESLPGPGGTVGMDWWFKADAIFLDTAGETMFEEVEPGETSAWSDYLEAIRISRRKCPINGLLLMIPIDKLKQYSQGEKQSSLEEIEQTAREIRKKLWLITESLDIRFPVYIVVTKCDLLVGFDQFSEQIYRVSESIHEPGLQHQIVGWSNPEKELDRIFSWADTESLLVNEAVGIIRKRCLGLLRDAVRSEDSNRLSEVNLLYQLPNELKGVVPRLRLYLETIFSGTSGDAKPPFLRGVYFTSSLREGAVLNYKLAQALGVDPADLPQRKREERAFFLRDLFEKKIFPEQRLITTANETKRLRKKRAAYALFAAAIALLLVIGLAIWLGKEFNPNLPSGFPLTSGVARAMTVADVKEAKAKLLESSKEFSSRAQSSRPFAARQWAKEQLSKRVEPRLTIVEALLDDRGEARSCKISLGPTQHTNLDYYPFIQIYEGTAPRDLVLKRLKANEELGDFRLDSDLTLRIYAYRDTPVNTFVFKPWGPIRLLHERAARSDEGSDRIVKLRVGQGTNQTSLALKLKFDKPLPPLAKWPTQ